MKVVLLWVVPGLLIASIMKRSPPIEERSLSKLQKVPEGSSEAAIAEDFVFRIEGREYQGDLVNISIQEEEGQRDVVLFTRMDQMFY